MMKFLDQKSDSDAHRTPPFPQPHPFRLAVAITFFFRRRRLASLAKNIRLLVDFPVEHVDITIHTNRMEVDEFESLERLCEFHRAGDRPISIMCCVDAPGDFVAAWNHRKDILSSFDRQSATHFIYIEDDMALTYQNFLYFVENRHRLAPFGLIPGFLRYEVDPYEMEFYQADFTAPFDRGECQFIESEDGLTFVTPPAALYFAAFILDNVLAEQFVESASFKRETSRSLSPWGDPERAAMGLCHEGKPDSFSCRYALPVNRERSRILRHALLHHSDNDHSDRKTGGSPFGKVKLASFFYRED